MLFLHIAQEDLGVSYCTYVPECYCSQGCKWNQEKAKGTSLDTVKYGLSIGVQYNTILQAIQVNKTAQRRIHLVILNLI